jgi:hypothetical protein
MVNHCGGMTLVMKSILTLLALAVSALNALAVSYTYTPTPADLNDLDHHMAYTWRIDNINLGNATITGATLTFNNIANWDPNPNILFIHLLDTAKYSGVSSFIDSPNDTGMADNFAGSLLASNPLVASGTGNTLLTSKSFTMTPVNYTYTFTAAQLASLQAYITNGKNIAFGLDPDCHFFNNGVTFSFSVPEGGTTAALLALTVIVFGILHRKFSPDRQEVRLSENKA